VVQTAVHKVLSPIFEADFFGLQYGFRPGLDAKSAVRKVHWCVTRERKTEVVDADLKDYFTSIPHGPLFRSLSRRVADGSILAVIKAWVTAPVVERDGRLCRRTTQARDLSRGTAQGSPLSPLLSNVYFRRFMAAWYRHGHARRFRSTVVNYADDFVICCEPGFGAGAKRTMEAIMAKIGLQINVEKTKLVNLPDDAFDFLGYSFCRSFTSDGRQFVGTRPSRKAVKKVIAKIHDETSRRWFGCTIEKRVAEINAIIRGWSNYFNQGPVLPEYRYIRAYTERRLRKWLMRKHKRQGTGYRQYPDDYLYRVLGLYQLPWCRGDRPSAKA
jgi:group II intron reverse transcriptase/maturase